MRAVIYGGVGRIAVETVADPAIQDEDDVIVRVTAASICGTDVRFYWGTMNTMIPVVPGDPLGHEFVGVIEEVGRAVHHLRKGQRVVSPFAVHCGTCFYCENDLLTACENLQAFGLSKAWGALGGGQAEYVRVPAADRTLLPLDDRVSDEQATVLPDVMSGVFAGMEFLSGREIVAVVGCGPTGLAAVMCARLRGALKVLAIDHRPDRLARAASCGAIPINFDEQDPLEAVREHTGGRGVDVAADAVGKPGTIQKTCTLVRRYGSVVLLGYIDPTEHCAIGELGLAHIAIRPALVPPTRKYQHRVMRLIAERRLDPSVILTHTLPLDEAPRAYQMMADRIDGAVKIVLRP
jgi:threonine dehydrogenase-like Zn-dependent dehydrogenase